jgi:fatty acid desaturase
MKNSDYARVLIPLIPRQAFEPNPYKLIVCAIHLSIIVAGWASFPFIARIYWPLLSLVIGTSLTCIALIAHDVSHRNVVRNKFVLYPTELLLWALICVPATVWKRVHSYHHVVTNSIDDPKRRFLQSETSIVTATYGKLFYPHRGLKYNLLCLLNFATSNIRNIVAAFYLSGRKPQLVPSRPSYTVFDKLKIVFEIAVIIAIQAAIWEVSGRGGYIPASLIPLLIVSAVTSFYLLVSHSLKPLREDGDALEGTTSIILPRIIDKLHVNQSYHTEHHLFPNMNPDYYPQVGRLIEKYFPRAYHRIPASVAWSQLWSLPLFIAPP